MKRLSWAIVAIASFALLVLGFDARNLGWETVSGQTVPRTPPPTFTPTRPATPRVSPTPTSLPTATPTFLPGIPTPVPHPDLAISLAADPSTVGPGDPVTFTCLVANRGNGSAGQSQITLNIAWPLAIEDVSASKGAASAGEQGATASVDGLGPDERVTITVHARVQENASPGKTLRLTAQVASDGDSRESNEVVIELPWAMLPATGG